MFRPSAIASLGVTFIFVTVVQAENIIDAHIEVVGGAEAIAEIETIQRTGSTHLEGAFGALDGTREETYDLSGEQGFTSIEVTGFSSQTGWSGESGWKTDTNAGLTDMPAGELGLAKLTTGPSPLASLHAEHGGQVFQEDGDREFNEQECTVVTITGSPIEFYVNNETKLLEGLAMPGILQITFDDYMEVNGVEFANKASIEIAASGVTVMYEYESTELNGEIDASKFERPPGQRAGSTEPASTPGSVTAEQIVSSMDTNGDGEISEDEASEDLNLFFEQYDEDDDGVIDAKEARALANYANSRQTDSTEPASTSGNVTAEQIISFLDKNDDGKISEDEASEELKPFFEQIDANGDGAIDAKEAQVMADYANNGQNM